MKTLTCKCGRLIELDDEDYGKVAPFDWYCGNGNVHIKRAGSYITLSSKLVDCPDGMLIDHRDRNNHNFRKENLRPATRQQNCRNRKGVRNGFKGAYYFRPAGKWMAAITVNYKQKHLGYFETEEQAARAYDLAAKELFGEFASLNFP